MLPTTKIDNLKELFKGKGFNPIIGTIFRQQEKWKTWYRGSVNEFHFYNARTPHGNIIQRRRKSLNMAKKICEDWAGLIFNENTSLIVEEDKAQKVIEDVLERTAFVYQMSDFIEKTFMTGTGVIVPYIDKGEVEIDFLTENIVPLSSRGTVIDELATIQEFKGEKNYTHVTYHTYRDGIYRVEHELYEHRERRYLGNRAPLQNIFSEAELSRMNTDGNERYWFEYKTPTPFFFVFKPAVSNNFDTNSPMGISIFANSIDVLAGIDQEFDGMVNETELSRKRLLVGPEAMKTSKITEQSENDVAVRYVRGMNNEDTLFEFMNMPEDMPFKDFTPEYRVDPYIQGLKFKLSMLAAKSGLGNHYYQFDMEGGVTATQVISVKSDTWKNREKHVKRLRETLKGLMYAILSLQKSTNGYTGNPDALEYRVEFDDSIIVDDDARIKQMTELANQGYLPKWRVVSEYLNIGEDKAKEIVQEAKADDDIAALIGMGDRDDDTESQEDN